MTMIKGKVAKVTEDAASGEVTVEVEDVLGGGLRRLTADLVVLGDRDAARDDRAAGVAYDSNGSPPAPPARCPCSPSAARRNPRRRRHGAGRHRGRPQGHQAMARS